MKLSTSKKVCLKITVFSTILSIFVHLFSVVWRRELSVVRLRGVHTDSEFKVIHFKLEGQADQLDAAVDGGS